MANASCPNCGKPVRPGGKFCGNCGQTLSSTTSSPASTSSCPHCGKPVRQGAQFCSHCGETITQGEASIRSSQQPTVPAESKQTAPGAQPTASSSQPETVSGKPVVPPPGSAAAGAATARRRYRYLPWLVLLAIFLCVVILGLGFYIVNPGGILSSSTDTPTPTFIPPATATQALPTETLTPLPTSMPTIAPPTETLPIIPTDTSLPEVITPTITTLPPAGNVIIDEEFNTILAMNWNIWGEPRPIIEQGFGDNFLSLTATNPGDAGVTSKEDFVLQPGVEIDFGAQLQPGYSQYVLVFSWDPNQFVRQPGNNEPGVLQMEVSADKVTIKSALTIEMCVASIRGADAHDFSFRILDDNRVALYVDNLDEPVCTLVDIGMDAPIVGRITFRSMGLVSNVYVASP